MNRQELLSKIKTFDEYKNISDKDILTSIGQYYGRTKARNVELKLALGELEKEVITKINQDVRPKMINPETLKIMDIYSDDFNNLLSKGYNINALLNSPLKISPNIPLTGYVDLDYEIMMYLNLKDLEILCHINHYTKKLCDNKTFWLKRIKFYNLERPDIEIDNINWLHYYRAIVRMKQYEEVKVLEISTVNNYQIIHFINMFNKLNIDIPEKLKELQNAIIKTIDMEEEKITIYYLDNNNNTQWITIKKTHDKLKLIVFYLYYYYIVKL